MLVDKGILMKLYRDGSIGSFSNYKKALSLSLSFGVLAGFIFWRLLLRDNGLLGEFETQMKVISLIAMFLTSTFLLFVVYRRPLIILKNEKFIFYTGLFNSDYILVYEIKKFKIFSDEESISVDIYNKANLRTTFETRALSNLEEQIKKLIEENLNLEVDCVNSSTNKAVHVSQ